jgi:hypothetical protein
MSNSQFEFSEEAEQMHAGAVEWEERREVMEELNEKNEEN